jgi:hypothetical protein
VSAVAVSRVGVEEAYAGFDTGSNQARVEIRPDAGTDNRETYAGSAKNTRDWTTRSFSWPVLANRLLLGLRQCALGANKTCRRQTPQ